MRKLLVASFIIFAGKFCYALPVGNPSEASFLCDGWIFVGHHGYNPCLTWCDAFSLRAGFYGNYVFERHFRNHKHRPKDYKQLDHFRYFTNALYMAFNIWDRADLFGTIGATTLHLEGNVSNFAPFTALPVGQNGSRITFVTDSSFSWSIGGRYTLFRCCCTSIGVEAEYFRTDAPVRRSILARLSSDFFDNRCQALRALYSEWQVGIGISQCLCCHLIPYAAIKWSGARLRWLDFDKQTNVNHITLNDLMDKKLWGYAIGLSIIDCCKTALTVEGRFGDEKALYVNAQLRL